MKWGRSEPKYGRIWEKENLVEITKIKTEQFYREEGGASSRLRISFL